MLLLLLLLRTTEFCALFFRLVFGEGRRKPEVGDPGFDNDDDFVLMIIMLIRMVLVLVLVRVVV